MLAHGGFAVTAKMVEDSTTDVLIEARRDNRISRTALAAGSWRPNRGLALCG